MRMIERFRAALFDLDGVVIDTESQYSRFWAQMGHEFRPDVDDFAARIKGRTLQGIFDTWFAGRTEEQREITRRLNDYEARMEYTYIRGTRAYAKRLRESGIRTAIVTSSNLPKMNCLYRARPELPELFERIFTSEDFTAGKPAPDCYLHAAAAFGIPPQECVVFEDSINGLRAGRDSGAYVVGLATSLPREVIAPLCDKVIDHFEELL